MTNSISEYRYQKVIPSFQFGILILLVFFCSAPKVRAATRNVACSGDITSQLNNAISGLVNGDMVSISSGNCSMSRLQMISNKNITIQGAGKGATNITANNGFADIESTGSTAPNWRVTGISFSGSGNLSSVITVWANQSASWRGPFRIDHTSMNYPNAGPDGLIAIYGPVWGLIDSNDFYQNYEAVILTGLELSSETGSSISNLKGAYAASLAFRPGASDYLYIENNNFTGTGGNGVAAIDTGYTGGRYVFRYNNLTNATLYAHWTSDNNVNSLWWEVYNNKFTWNLGAIYPMRMQGGGTGLIYNNTITGFSDNFILLGDGRLPDQGQSGSPTLFCDGTHNWDGNAGDTNAPGWPCLAQTGRNAGKTIAQIQSGDKQTTFPLYLWNNGPQNKCSNLAAAGSACDNSFHISTYSPSAVNYFKSTPHTTSGFGNGDVDYSITASQPAGAGTHTLTYAPFIYPYSLDASGMPDATGGTPPPTPTPSPTPVVGDINLDHIVNAIDYSILNSHWFTTDASSDLNKDGIANAIDYSMLNANWFKTW